MPAPSTGRPQRRTARRVPPPLASPQARRGHQRRRSRRWCASAAARPRDRSGRRRGERSSGRLDQLWVLYRSRFLCLDRKTLLCSAFGRLASSASVRQFPHYLRGTALEGQHDGGAPSAESKHSIACGSARDASATAAAVLPSSSRAKLSAPCAIRSRATSIIPSSSRPATAAATCKGVRPPSATSDTDAPCAKSSDVIHTSPFSAAICSGVAPINVPASMYAPTERSAETTSG